MTRLLLPLGVLALAIALLPSASAQATDDDCGAGDVLDLEIVAHRGEGEGSTTATYDELDGNVQPGDTLHVRITTNMDCEGLSAYAVSVLAGEGEEDRMHDVDVASLEGDASGTLTAELVLEVPDCAFKAALVVDEELLEETSGGEGVCHPEWGDGSCTVEDMQYAEFYFADGDRFESSDTLEPAREGDTIYGQGTTDPDCEGELFTLVVSTRMGDEVALFDSSSSVAFRPREHFDFAFWEVDVDVPACEFLIEFYFGDAESGELLLSHEGGATPCTGDETPPAELECVSDLAGTAGQDASITIAWGAAEGAETYYVLRAAENDDEGWRLVAELDAETLEWRDETTEAGVAYAYQVVVGAGDSVSGDCPIIEVTAVPFFGAPILGALALVGGVGAYAALRRRS